MVPSSKWTAMVWHVHSASGALTSEAEIQDEAAEEEAEEEAAEEEEEEF